MLALGAALIAVGWFISSETRAISANGATAQAEVSELVRNVRNRIGRPDSITFCARMNYTVNGRRQTLQGACSNPAIYKVGDKVEVMYDRVNPERAMVNTFTELWLGPVFFGVAGILAALIGIVLALRSLLRMLRGDAQLMT